MKVFIVTHVFQGVLSDVWAYSDHKAAAEKLDAIVAEGYNPDSDDIQINEEEVR